MRKNDIINLNIDAMSSEGSGIGRYDSVAVFVPNSAVGDSITAKVLKVKSNCAFAKIEEIITPSPDRIKPDCDVFLKCGGCVYRHISYDAELDIKQRRVEDAVRRIGKVDLSANTIVSNKKITGYRNKAQYPVAQSGEVGFFANHSHRIIPCENCKLQPHEFSAIANIFKEWMHKSGNTVYDEGTSIGLVRHLYIRKAFATGQIMVCLVVNGNSVKSADNFVSALQKELGDDLKTVVLNINKEKTNVILSDKCVNLYGDGYIYDILCGVKVRISPLSFYQVNRDMAELLYKKVAEYADIKGKTLLDLYCGAGTIGLSMADKAENVIGVEIIHQAVEDAIFNAKNNGVKNARFLCADAAEAAKTLHEENIKPDVVVVDPPRKGCSADLISTITDSFSPERVVYVSCDAATMARDIKMFTDKNYQLKEYTPFDLFPRTVHTECVALLQRASVDTN